MVDCRKCEHAEREGSEEVFCAVYQEPITRVKTGACKHYKEVKI